MTSDPSLADQPGPDIAVPAEHVLLPRGPDALRRTLWELAVSGGVPGRRVLAKSGRQVTWAALEGGACLDAAALAGRTVLIRTARQLPTVLALFPAAWVGAAGPVGLRVTDDTLCIRSARTASGYLGAARPLADADGFIDTGDIIVRRGDRYHFLGRLNVVSPYHAHQIRVALHDGGGGQARRDDLPRNSPELLGPASLKPEGFTAQPRGGCSARRQPGSSG